MIRLLRRNLLFKHSPERHQNCRHFDELISIYSAMRQNYFYKFLNDFLALTFVVTLIVLLQTAPSTECSLLNSIRSADNFIKIVLTFVNTFLV